MEGEPLENGEFILDERVLCSDEACIGLVGPDGKCKECGLVYTGDDPLPGSGDASTEKPKDQENESRVELDENSKEEVIIDNDERICCPDDACIGIIGPNGTCGTCGKTNY